MLDLQIQFLQEDGLPDLARWLVRKWDACKNRKATAQKMLDDSGLTLEDLEVLWADQVRVQTRPLVAARAGLAKAAIKSILDLAEYQKSITKEIDSLDRLVNTGGIDVADVEDRRSDLVVKLENVISQIRRKRGQLGVSERANLKQMESSPYLKVHFFFRLLFLGCM